MLTCSNTGLFSFWEAVVKTIAVYGSSMVQPGEADYIAAYDVGAALALADFAVMTGGYGGIMEAASRGAAEAGGHVIGVTTDVIEALRQRGANQWVRDEIRHATLRERLMHLVLNADGYVVMPGGLGTLHELVTVWELMRTRDIPTAPVICYGDYWTETLQTLRESPYIRPDSWDMLNIAHSPDAVVDLLKRVLP